MPKNPSQPLLREGGIFTDPSLLFCRQDIVIVNGERTSVNRRTRELLRVLRSRSGLGDADVIGRGVVVVSTNNFPTASGLASSASGFAALAYALCHYFKVSHSLSTSLHLTTTPPPPLNNPQYPPPSVLRMCNHPSRIPPNSL